MERRVGAPPLVWPKELVTVVEPCGDNALAHGEVDAEGNETLRNKWVLRGIGGHTVSVRLLQTLYTQVNIVLEVRSIVARITDGFVFACPLKEFWNPFAYARRAVARCEELLLQESASGIVHVQPLQRKNLLLVCIPYFKTDWEFSLHVVKGVGWNHESSEELCAEEISESRKGCPL